MTVPDRPGSESGLALLGAALDALEEGVQILSPSFRYLFLNEAACRQGRKPRAELLGRTMMECYPGIADSAMFGVLRRSMEARRPEAMENEFVYEDGRRAHFELRIRPCPAGVILLSLDVTQRKNSELELQEAYQRALQDLITPVLRVHTGVLLVPLVGALHAERAGRITETVLTRVVDAAAKVVILDVSGVPTLDAHVAGHLLQATAMIRLVGAASILTGISAAAAKTIVQLGADLSSIETTSHLADGIELARVKLGLG